MTNLHFIWVSIFMNLGARSTSVRKSWRVLQSQGWACYRVRGGTETAPGKAHRGRGRLPGSPLHSTYNPSQHLYLSFSRTLLMFFPYSVHFMFCSYSRHTTRLGQSKEFSRCRSRWFNVLFVPIHAVHFMHKHVWDKHTSNLYYLKLNQLEL